MVKLLIFDMDGTLVDTDEVLYETWAELFRLYKPKDYVIDREFVRGFSGPPIEQSIARAFPEKDPKFILKEYRTRTAKYYDDYLKFFPNEKEVLKKLYKEGYILTISTSKNRPMAEKCLKIFGVYDWFSEMITSSEDVPHKPDPTSLNLLVEKFNVKKEEALMIGDTSFDALAAINANIKSVLLKLCPRVYEKDKMPTYFVANYQELYELIKKI